MRIRTIDLKKTLIFNFPQHRNNEPIIQGDFSDTKNLGFFAFNSFNRVLCDLVNFRFAECPLLLGFRARKFFTRLLNSAIGLKLGNRHFTRQLAFYPTNFSGIGICTRKLVQISWHVPDTIKLELNFVARQERKQHKHTTHNTHTHSHSHSHTHMMTINNEPNQNKQIKDNNQPWTLLPPPPLL